MGAKKNNAKKNKYTWLIIAVIAGLVIFQVVNSQQSQAVSDYRKAQKSLTESLYYSGTIVDNLNQTANIFLSDGILTPYEEPEIINLANQYVAQTEVIKFRLQTLEALLNNNEHELRNSGIDIIQQREFIFIMSNINDRNANTWKAVIQKLQQPDSQQVNQVNQLNSLLQLISAIG